METESKIDNLTGVRIALFLTRNKPLLITGVAHCPEL